MEAAVCQVRTRTRTRTRTHTHTHHTRARARARTHAHTHTHTHASLHQDPTTRELSPVRALAAGAVPAGLSPASATTTGSTSSSSSAAAAAGGWAERPELVVFAGLATGAVLALHLTRSVGGGRREDAFCRPAG